MKKLESGRSMVEMLGVLAIIGVLSIGGISGYTLSMPVIVQMALLILLQNMLWLLMENANRIF